MEIRLFVKFTRLNGSDDALAVVVKVVIVVVVAVAFTAVVIKKVTQKLNALTKLVPKSIFLGDKYP